RMEGAELVVVPFRKGRDVVLGVAERRPDQTIALHRAMRGGARLQRRRRIGMRRDQHTFGIAVIAPPVIGADDGAIDHPALGQLGAAVNAEILPYLDFAGVAPDDQLLSEELSAEGLSIGN